MPVNGVDRAAEARAQQDARAEQIRADSERRRAEADQARQQARAQIENNNGGRAVDVRG
jgi:hypothetical protein